MSQSQEKAPDDSEPPKVEATTTKSTYEKITGPFGIEPKHLFLVASVPLCMGAYSGFRNQMKHAERQAKRAAKRKAAGKPPLPLRLTADSRVIGARALGVATMMSCGGFAFLGAVTFYASGYRSFQEAFDSFRGWGRKRRVQLEGWHGINLSRDHPDMVATKNMTEEEEFEYVRKKYLADDTILRRSSKQKKGWNLGESKTVTDEYESTA